MTESACSDDHSALVPLSFGQEALWFFEQVVGKSTVYHVPLAYRIKGGLDATRLGEAMTAVVERHEVLRTAVIDSDGTAHQVVLQPEGPYLTINDLSDSTPSERPDAADAILRGQIVSPLDLASGEVFRACLIRFDSTDHLLIIVLHHIATDGWSNRLLISELSEAYSALLAGKDITQALTELPVQYADYAWWQREWLSGPALEARLSYWSDQLDGLLPLELRSLAPRPRRPTFAASRLITEVHGTVHARAVDTARQARVSLLSELAAAFSLTLAALTGRADISFGTMFAGRADPDLEHLIGCFVNAVVLRSDLSDDPTFRVVTQQLNRSISDAIDREVPFGSVVERTAPRRTLPHNPLFHVVVQLLSGSAAPIVPHLPGASCQAIDAYQGQHPFDLTVTFIMSGERLTMHVEYSLELFDEAFAQSFADRLLLILDLGTAAPNSTAYAVIRASDASRPGLSLPNDHS